MTKYGIETSAMLVEFTASVWTARKLDRSTTDEVVTSKNAAARDAARVNKHLLAGRSELDVVNKHVTATRNWVNERTMPWSDSGLRLLPTVAFMEFDKALGERVEEYWRLVEQFVTVYPTLITAQAMALGDMFKRDDYPDPASIKGKFDIGVNYLPVPSAGDWRVDIGAEAQAELSARLEKLADERVEQAKQHVRNMLREHLARMSDRLTVDTVNGETKPRIFRDSLVEWGFELVDLVSALNVTNDPEIEAARRELERTISGVEPKELRENFAVRKEVKENVDDIMRKFSW